MYAPLFEERGVGGVTQYVSRIMRKLTKRQRKFLSVAEKQWTIGDRLYKLAAKHYGDPSYWWVIARFNNKPTEAHFKVGDVVYIPLPRESILEMYGV